MCSCVNRRLRERGKGEDGRGDHGRKEDGGQGVRSGPDFPLVTVVVALVESIYLLLVLEKTFRKQNCRRTKLRE